MQKFIYELNSNEHDNIEVNRSTRHFATESNMFYYIEVLLKPNLWL
jgi:hypothetical protein